MPGRTGHDYPNQWLNDALDWFGKSGSAPAQPMIGAMISGGVTTHIFWRGRDRAPFTYAGVGIAEGVWGEKPVEVLWRLSAIPQTPPTPEIGSSPPFRSGSEIFRHGPPPSVGLKQMLAVDGECYLYLMVLEGAVDAIFPTLAPSATCRSVVKVGISREPQRRVRELNISFPKGAAASWTLRQSRTFATALKAYAAEGSLLQGLVKSKRWLSGEFAIIPDDEILGILD